MANLVAVTKESRLILKVGGIFCGVILLIYIFVKGGGLMRDLFFPKPPPAPVQALGKLPHVAFPQQQEPSGLGTQFTINTIDGQLPNFPDRVNVYKLTVAEPNLLALETARNTLDSSDFVENQTKLTDTLYRWTQARTGIVIEYDIVSKNFAITSNYMTNPFLTSSSLLPEEDRIQSDMMGFLNTIGSNTDNLDEEKTKVEYLEMKNGVLVAAENLGSARFARITMEQIAIDEIPIIYGGPSNSILSFVISYPNNRFSVVEGEFYNHVVDDANKSDYPIKTAEQALTDLKNGNAYMINPQNLTNVDITTVELRYFLGRESKEFLLPVIVFSGINFTGYVEAIPATSLAN
ncbi:MAG: hypothetical protein Q7T54_03490 [Candidatus Levybacteria bacterium]|nr:hypothetical protein [Candidatus Levybacteria bacterium]